jgi:hypothetical protein
LRLFLWYLVPNIYANCEVIVLAMIGPEARKKDQIKEHAEEMGMDNSSDFSGEKAHSDGGHGDGEEAARTMDNKLERGNKRSEDTIENEGIDKVYPAQKIVV